MMPRGRKLKLPSIFAWSCSVVSCFFAVTVYGGSLMGPSTQPEAYFNGSSYLRFFYTPISLKRLTGLSFRTCAGGGLFSEKLLNDSLELSVTSEGVIFLAIAGRKQYEEKIVGDFLDNKWHLVLLQYKLGKLVIEIDGGKARVIANSTYRSDLLESLDLYKDESAVLLVGKQFTGCLLEGPSLVFNATIISNQGVEFGKCPIPEDNCMTRDFIKIDHCQNEPCMRHGTCHNGPNSYTCECHVRYTGKNCEIDTGDPCSRPICKNGATCNSDSNGTYFCTCPGALTGKHCEYDLLPQQPCQFDPCENGAHCQTDSSNPNAVHCGCLPGFTGDHCETNIDDCVQEPCKNGGVCFDGLNNFTCDCGGTGYRGRFCENNVNECLEGNPCLNFGICFDTYGGYLCQCPSGFGGRDCQLSQTPLECSSMPCLNRGECVDITDRGYVCKCPHGYGGKNCELEEKQVNANCDHSSCLPYGYCVDFGQTTGCKCKPEYPGYYPNCSSDSSNTINANACGTNPCKNGGICSLTNSGASVCSCQHGYAGPLCQLMTTAASTSTATCHTLPCLNGGTCLDLPTGGARCNCTDHYRGAQCEHPVEDICASLRPCLNNATCVPIVSARNGNKFRCNCLPGFEGNRCESDIDDCVTVSCPAGKSCRDLVDGYECRCPAGVVGENCDIADPCGEEVCLGGGTCVVDGGLKPTCHCPSTYTGAHCEQDVDECKEIPGICNDGICVNKNGTFQCFCKPGYTGEHCDIDFDECLSTPCQNQATCIDKINNYECTCFAGYEGKNCESNIDDCQSNPCENGATCVDGVNEFTCVCQPGLTGKVCEININDCASSPCLNGAQCIDGLNMYTCNCTDTGYTGVHCEVNIDDCLGDPCMNNGTCVDEVKNHRCECHPGYRGHDCQEDINECEISPCKYGGTCLEKSNRTLYELQWNVTLPETFSRPFDYLDAAGYECLCSPGITGANCEINIDECESSPCVQGKCLDRVNGYTCECDPGFEGAHCEMNIDECDKYKPCVYGECIDQTANYLCRCEIGYGGKNCSVKLSGCDENRCRSGGTCIPYLVNEVDHRFNCSCPRGYHGDLCEMTSTMSLSGRSMVTVNTVREENYDIQFRFKTTLEYGLLALGTGGTYYSLYLSKGRLNLRSSLLNKWDGVFIGSNLNNSTWQRVFVAINSTHLVLSANDEQTIYPITYNDNCTATCTSFAVTYIGGYPSNLKSVAQAQPFFVGCTEDVAINGEWVLPQSPNSTWLMFQGVDVGCSRESQCKPNPCHSGGHCTDLWRDFKCACERPYLGHTCHYNYTAATFGYENISDSLVTVAVGDSARRAVRTVVDISMFIRTRQSRGQIFYLGSVQGGGGGGGGGSSTGNGNNNAPEETYIAAQLEGGELLVRIQFNATPEAYTVGGVKLNNGYDHLIEVIRNVTLVQVKLNGTEYFRKTISATGNLDAQILFLGGQPQLRPVRQANDHLMKVEVPTPSAVITPPLSNVHFKGVIQDVQINNGSATMVVEFFPLQAKDLEIPMSFGNVTFDKSTVLEGVRSDDLCRNNPCVHNGICENTWNDYKCNCTVGYKGKNCTDLEFCQVNKCPDGSICRNLENGYECISNATFDGTKPALQYGLVVSSDSSKENESTLESASLSIVSVNNKYSENVAEVKFNTLELNYRTRSWGTVLYAERNGSYFTIFIYHNEVVVLWNIDRSSDSVRFRRDDFDGQWLTLFFVFTEVDSSDSGYVFKGGFKEWIVDDNPHFSVTRFNFTSFVDIIRKGVIYVAGSDDSFNYQNVIQSLDYLNATESTTTVYDTNGGNAIDNTSIQDLLQLYKVDQNKKTDHFKGCLGEIRIGGLLLPFFPMKELYPSYKYFNESFYLRPDKKPTTECFLCQQSDCFNGGRCVDARETYSCQCPDGYDGADCSVDVDECESNRCQNNATCVDLVARYECRCQMGFEGLNCEIDIDECESDPCKHGGNCTDLIGGFQCDCTEDFVGTQCDTPRLITCDNKPCKKGATCQPGYSEATGNNFTCLCTEGYKGTFCDTAFCLLRHCEHGSCNTKNPVPYCQCDIGFDGQYCEVNIDDCAKSPCQNGGVCMDGINRYDCNCTGTGFTGESCEIDIDECERDNPCGRAKCVNLRGSYKCKCSEKGKCGHFCNLDDLCETERPCVNGECVPQCLEKSDYICTCRDNYIGKNCTELKVSASQVDGGINILYIIVPIVLILLVAFAIGMMVLVNVARSKRATRGTYSPSAQEFCNPRVELDHVLKPPPEERLI